MAAGRDDAPHVLYVVTGYPYVSHTFIQREVLALRELGATVDTVAVRRADLRDVLSDEDRREFATTFTLRPFRPLRYVRAHVRALASPSARWLTGLRSSLALTDYSPRSIAWRFFYFVQAVVLWEHARARGARHIHAHHANVASDLAMLAAIIGGPGWSWSFTMHGPTEFADVVRHRLAEKARSADLIACISDYCRSQLMGLMSPDQWGKLTIVHCGVDPERFAPVAPAPDGRGLRVISIARFTAVKGHAVLLDAARLLRERGTAVEFTLIGDGPERSRLEEQIRREDLGATVELTGALGQDEVHARLSSADLLCLTSFAEGVPVVLMEAMSMGLPVVTSRVAGIPELVQDGESGLVVAPGRADLVAEAIQSLADDPRRRREMGAAGRRRVISEYSVTPNAQRLLAAFAAVAEA